MRAQSPIAGFLRTVMMGGARGVVAEQLAERSIWDQGRLLGTVGGQLKRRLLL